MRDWIVGLQKGAAERGEGVDPSRWAQIEQEIGEVPEELKDLFEAMNGGRLPPDVRLLPFEAEGGAVDQSRASYDGLPDSGVWVFGARGDDEQLFAATKGSLANSGSALPDWVGSVDDERWIYGVRTGPGALKCYRSLEQLMGRLVPPVQTEEFGDITYARAFSAVRNLVEGLDDGEDTEVTLLNDIDVEEAPAGNEDVTREVALYPPAQSRRPSGKKPAAAASKAKKPAAAAKKKSAARKPAKQASRKVAAKRPARKGPAKARKSTGKKPGSRKAAVRKIGKASGRKAGKPAKKKASASRGRR